MGFASKYRRTSSLVGLVLVVALIVAAVLFTIGLRQKVTGILGSHAPLQKIQEDASWAEGYRSLKDLKAHSDLVVEGTVTKALNTYKGENDIVFTDFEFSVTEVLANPTNVSVGSSVVLHQTGGIEGGKLYEVGDDPLFQPGEHLILFLRQYSPNHYYVVAGPQGRFSVEHGLVSPRPEHIETMSGPTAESEFIQQVKGA